MVVSAAFLRLQPASWLFQRHIYADLHRRQQLAMDGKTLKNAIDEAGHQTHIMSVIGHQSGICHAQKK
jgi:hypothetical protein